MLICVGTNIGNISTRKRSTRKVYFEFFSKGVFGFVDTIGEKVVARLRSGGLATGFAVTLLRFWRRAIQ